jgi:hypothetical protein
VRIASMIKTTENERFIAKRFSKLCLGFQI